MSNQAIFIPSGGVGEMYFENEDWYKHDSSDFDKDKSIPFIKLLNDPVGFGACYYRNQNRMGRYENYPLLPKNVIKIASLLKRSNKKIKKLSDNLFCTGDIQTIDYCLEVYRQYVNNKSSDFFYIMIRKLNKPYQNYIHN